MKTIWKAVLDTFSVQKVVMPRGAKVLHVGQQYGRACLWFSCDPMEPREDRAIGLVGTGGDVPTDGKYLGTIQLNEGTLILHVFEREEER